MPSALAVFRFTAISNFVGNCTGREIARLCAAQDAIDISGGTTREVHPVDVVAAFASQTVRCCRQSRRLLKIKQIGVGLYRERRQ